MTEPRPRLWLDAAVAGAAAGVLAEVMVYRLNPELIQAPGPILVGAPLWASWGAVGFGLPLLLGALLVRRLLRRGGDWWVPELAAMAYLTAAVVSNLNSGLHEHLLSPEALRVLEQDAVAWGVGVLLALVGGGLVRRRRSTAALRALFALALMLLPLVRLLAQSTPPGAPLQVEPRPIGSLERRLLVVGAEGLDSGVLLGWAADARYQNLERLRRTGSWGVLEPHRPHLRGAAWTSLATGTYPERHGLKSHWGWLLPWQPQAPLRLLPWTPSGSRLILPWGLAERVTPPAASVPPLWQRVRLSGVATTVLAWPGQWSLGVRMDPTAAPADADAVLSSLAWMVANFPERGPAVSEAMLEDEGRVGAAVAALEGRSGQVWIHLEGLAVARRELQPLKPRHTREREVMAIALQLLDDQLGELLAAAGSDAVVAVVAPYGLAPPDSWERLQRLLGARDDWRTSAETCPEGLVMLSGPGVVRDRRLDATQLPDVAPTLCYLAGLPVAQYMQGRVVVEAVEPGFLETHPMRVID
jgi:hypothetical protein